MRLPPISTECFDLPDEDLGRLLLGYFIAANAEPAGFDYLNIPRQYAERITQLARDLPDDHCGADNDSLLLAVRLATHGDFGAAGKKLKTHTKRGAEFMAAMDIVSNLERDAKAGAKVRRSAKWGHEATHGDCARKTARWNDYQDYIDRLSARNPHLSHSDLLRRAAENFGVSTKTIQRHTTKPQKSEQS